MNEKLKQAVIKQLGTDNEAELMETLKDVCEHGADCGFHGFIYYSETVKFWEENRAEILEDVFGLANEIGLTVSEMVSGFRCLSGFKAAEIERFLSGLEVEGSDLIGNALAWFALEETARSMID